MIARAKQKLPADVDGSVLRRADVDRRVPVEAQFALFVLRQRLDVARLVRLAVNATDVPALRLGIEIVGV
jgi:hypothetical protein